MPIRAQDIAIDLGTTNMMLYVRGKGIVINEPTAVVVEARDRRVVRAVGDEARYLLGRTRDTLKAIRPIRYGNIADFDATVVMLRYFIRKAVGTSHLSKPKVLISNPAGLDEVSRKAIREAVQLAGARQVIFVEKPLAAAMGAGLPAYEPVGTMVVDLGGGTTDTAIISLGGIVVAQSVKVGGETMDQAIVDYLKKNSSMLVGEETAEEIKIDLASADTTLTVNNTAMVRGFDLLSARVMNAEFTAAQAQDAVRDACQAILTSIRWVLERTPPELASDIMRSGIHLTGGTAQLAGLDRMIAGAIGIPVSIASNPTDATVMGMGYLLENPDMLAAVSRSVINRF